MLEWADLWKNFPGLAFGLTMLWLYLKSERKRDEERTVWLGREDNLVALLLKWIPEGIKSDTENVLALKSVAGGLASLKETLERVERKVNP